MVSTILLPIVLKKATLILIRKNMQAVAINRYNNYEQIDIPTFV